MDSRNIRIKAGDKTSTTGLTSVAFHPVKTSPGRLHALTVHNAGVATAYIQLYDNAEMDIVMMVAVFKLPADSTIHLTWGDGGRPFDKGIVVAGVTEAGGEITVAGDLFIDATYE